MSWPRFDSTISFGHILTVVSLLIMGFGAWNVMSVRVAAHDIRLDQVEKNQLLLVETVKDIGALQRDVAVIRDRLERGNAR